jgi:hypothetical protein
LPSSSSLSFEQKTMAPSSSTPLIGAEEDAETWFRAAVTAVDVAHNWRWILAVGVLNVASPASCA